MVGDVVDDAFRHVVREPLTGDEQIFPTRNLVVTQLTKMGTHKPEGLPPRSTGGLELLQSADDQWVYVPGRVRVFIREPANIPDRNRHAREFECDRREIGDVHPSMSLAEIP
jgi:hypothetical protein